MAPVSFFTPVYLDPEYKARASNWQRFAHATCQPFFDWKGDHVVVNYANQGQVEQEDGWHPRAKRIAVVALLTIASCGIIFLAMLAMKAILRKQHTFTLLSVPKVNMSHVILGNHPKVDALEPKRQTEIRFKTIRGGYLTVNVRTGDTAIDALRSAVLTHPRLCAPGLDETLIHADEFLLISGGAFPAHQPLDLNWISKQATVHLVRSIPFSQEKIDTFHRDIQQEIREALFPARDIVRAIAKGGNKDILETLNPDWLHQLSQLKTKLNKFEETESQCQYIENLITDLKVIRVAQELWVILSNSFPKSFPKTVFDLTLEYLAPPTGGLDPISEVQSFFDPVRLILNNPAFFSLQLDQQDRGAAAIEEERKVEAGT